MDSAEAAARESGTSSACDDATLIAQSRHVPERFGVLFDRHAPSIYRYVARRLGPDVADDIVAETFLIAFRRRDRYDPAKQNAGPWLFGIATNLIARHRRDEIRLLRAIARTGLDPVAAEPIADQATERAAASAVRRQLAAAVAGLSQPHRDVLLLTASGLGYEEVAGALGVPVGTVSSRLVRARRNVRAVLGASDPTDARGELGDG